MLKKVEYYQQTSILDNYFYQTSLSYLDQSICILIIKLYYVLPLFYLVPLFDFFRSIIKQLIRTDSQVMEKYVGFIPNHKQQTSIDRSPNRDFKRLKYITSSNSPSRNRRSMSETSQKALKISKQGIRTADRFSDVDPPKVRFSEIVSHSPKTKKKHNSSSILKKTRFSSIQKRKKTRTNSVNSLANQNPHQDTQSCDNPTLNKIFKQQYLTIIQNFGKDRNFIDKKFPPSPSSIFHLSADRKKSQLPDIKWMRIGQIFPQSQLIMWSSDLCKVWVQPSTGFASSYLALGFNCLRNNKALLRFMLESQQPNPQGVYYVKIFHGNFWKIIIIDDYIPVIEGIRKDMKTGKTVVEYKPAFLTVNQSTLISSGSRGMQKVDMWPFLIEKAFAKMYSSYEALRNGNASDFIQQITNRACQEIDCHMQTKFLKEKFVLNNQLIGFGETAEYKQVPLYMIGPSKINLILPTNKRRIIDIEQLPKYFQRVYVTGTHNYTYYGSCPIRQIKQSISVRYFELKNGAKVSLSILQKDQKHFQSKHQYEYSWVRVVLLQKQFSTTYRWIDGRYDNIKNIHIEAFLEAGEYYILIMPEWDKKIHDLNLIIRTKVPIRLQRRTYSIGMMEEGCTDLAQRFGILNQHNKYICSYNCIHQALGLIIENINNQKTKGEIRIVRSIKGLKSTKEIWGINRQFNKDKMLEVKIKGGQHYTIVLLMRKGIDEQFFKSFDFQNN